MFKLILKMFIELFSVCLGGNFGEDKILNTTETLLNNKKVTYAKSSCVMYTISLVIICLLLLVVIWLKQIVSCYFYHLRYWPKQKHLLPFKDTIIKLWQIRY